MRRWLALFFLILGVIPVAGRAQNIPLKNPPAKKAPPGPAHSSVLGAAAEFLRAEIAVQYPKAVVVISPNMLLPFGTSLPRANDFAEAFGPPHPANLLMGVERKDAIVVASRAKALDCNRLNGGKCLKGRVYLAAALTQPVFHGDSATVGALTLASIAPDTTAAPGSSAWKGSVGGSDLTLLLVKQGGKWRVINHKVLAKRSPGN